MGVSKDYKRFIVTGICEGISFEARKDGLHITLDATYCGDKGQTLTTVIPRSVEGELALWLLRRTTP